MRALAAVGKSWRKLRTRRGFMLLFAIGILILALGMAVMTETVAMRDVEFASRMMAQTRAYLNARSGIEVALARLGSEPVDLNPVDSQTGPKVPVGEYRVEMMPEVAGAFSDFLGGLPADTPVYLIQSVGRVPHRGGSYELSLVVVVQMSDRGPRTLIWSENPGGAK